ncbi:MAG: type IV-A pilus assembly ATPase PilB, partial [Thiotrichaceae bacterium IS1]
SNCRYLALAIAEELSVPVVDIDSIVLNPETLKKIDDKLIRKHQVLPIFERGNCLFIAISDPTNQSTLDEIKFHTKMDIEAVVVEADKLAKVIERALEVFDTSMKYLWNAPANIVLVDEDAEAETGTDDESEAEEAHIIKFVNKMLYDAIKMGAEVIHFEPYEKYYRVRFRVDGILRVISTPPVGLSRKLAARLKVMAGLDVTERRVPQHGRMKIKYGRGSIDFRGSIMPTRFGEKIVLRFLYGGANLNIEILGYEEEQKQLYLKALRNPHGMVLVTGPWDSGKTVSLYAGINILNEEGVNISTVEDEDPITEINLPGVNQVQVNEKTGLTFAKAIKEFLYQDPDIILVGEIRDLETGNITIKAAMTGHLVLSTLYANDAPATLTRLLDLGIPPFSIADADYGPTPLSPTLHL